MAQRFDARRLEVTGEASPVADQLTFTGTEFRGAFLRLGNRRSDIQQRLEHARTCLVQPSGPGVGSSLTPDAYDFPALSPDGREVCFLGGVEPYRSLWKTPVEGGGKAIQVLKQ